MSPPRLVDPDPYTAVRWLGVDESMAEFVELLHEKDGRLRDIEHLFITMLAVLDRLRHWNLKSQQTETEKQVTCAGNRQAARLAYDTHTYLLRRLERSICPVGDLVALIEKFRDTQLAAARRWSEEGRREPHPARFAVMLVNLILRDFQLLSALLFSLKPANKLLLRVVRSKPTHAATRVSRQKFWPSAASL